MESFSNVTLWYEMTIAGFISPDFLPLGNPVNGWG